MKKLFILWLSAFVFMTISAQDYYTKQWSIVKTSYDKGEKKSVLPLILEIQRHAMKDKNTVQLIKSLKEEYILSGFEEDEKNNQVSRFYSKLDSVEATLKGKDQLLFYFFKGKFVQQYYEINSWKLGSRTNIQSEVVSEIETWTKLDFKNFLSKYYSTLYKNNNILDRIPLGDLSPLFEDKVQLSYFKNLFDWYTLDYIDFLKNPSYFTRNELNINKTIVSKLFSELLSTKEGNALYYVKDLKLKYEFENKPNELYLKALQTLFDQTPMLDYKVELGAKIAKELFFEKKYNEAFGLIQDLKKNFSNSSFLPNVLYVENQIVAKNLELTLEEELQANKPIPLVVNYKNVDNFKVELYSVVEVDEVLLQSLWDKNKRKNIKKQFVKSVQYSLKDTKRFASHTTILEIPPIPKGLYLLEYENSSKETQYILFTATTSKIIQTAVTQQKKDEIIYKITDSEKGFNLKTKSVVLSTYHNNNSIKESVSVDEQGNFRLPKTFSGLRHRDILVEDINHGNFHFISNNNYPFSSDDEKATKSIQIFLDRAIYRPGQNVYFKAVTTDVNKHNSLVLSDRQQTVILFDANNNEIARQKLITNDYGSYHGNFVLPQGKLNGQFRIEVQDDKDKNLSNQYYFSVEEYKRPQFEIVFDPLYEDYKMGQKIYLKGKVNSYSGIPMANANLDYEIKKNDERWRYFPVSDAINSYENSIIGQVTTDKDGVFVIELDLDKEADVEGIQIFNYKINAFMTDINGESQSASQNVRVASVSHYITTKLIGHHIAEDDLIVDVAVKNYNDRVITKSYRAKLSKYDGAKRVIRDNLKDWVQDVHSYSKVDFIAKFPHDYYDESEVLYQGNKNVVWDKGSDHNRLNLGKLSPGDYSLEIYNIENKDTITTQQNFTVYSTKSIEKNQKPFLDVIFPKTILKKDEEVVFYVYSAIPNAPVNIIIQDGEGGVFFEQKKIKNGVLAYRMKTPNTNASHFKVEFQLVSYNDVQNKGKTFKLESGEDSLKINLITFRNKLEPNVKEKWKLSITGKVAEKVQAELLATMYDKSLDKFAPHKIQWNTLRANNYYSRIYDYTHRRESISFYDFPVHVEQYYVHQPMFSWFDNSLMDSNSRVAEFVNNSPVPLMREVSAMGGMKVKQDARSVDDLSDHEGDVSTKSDEVKIRENLNETAFFYPSLKTDENGNVYFEFTSPEALTKWKLTLLAHTKDARAGVLEQDVITQKEFSVTPNYPRFLREGDQMVFRSKISSLVDKVISGSAQLQILDALTNEDVTSHFGSEIKDQSFSIHEKGNTTVAWKLMVPQNLSSIIIKVVAQAGQYSDGEQKAVAVLPNRILVTDVQPIFVKEGETKTIVLESLKNNSSKTVQNVSNTLELTTNPIWDVLFALPSLKNESEVSADAVFNKWFADVVASEIFKANPKLKAVFDDYQNKDLLKSNLDKNQTLKQLLLEETPWVIASASEDEQMRKIAVLFDTNVMRFNILNDWNTFTALQNYDGGFSWTKDSPSSYTTSLYVLNQLGKINAWLKGNQKQYQGDNYDSVVKNLIAYVDTYFSQMWKNDSLNNWSNTIYNYLDTRRKWESVVPLPAKGSAAKEMVVKDVSKSKLDNFTFYGLHRLAILLDNYNDKYWSNKLLTYLKETSTNSKTQGSYWKNNLNNWGWYHSNFLNHAEALEAFNLLKPKDSDWIEDLKIWLVTQKESNAWRNSRATAEVIYLMLTSGESWTTTQNDKVDIIWGGKNVVPDSKATGYIKQSIKTPDINKDLSSVTITKIGAGIVQGGIFWQYLEDMDKVKSSESYLSIHKEYYRKLKTVNGEELKKITEQEPLKVGDRVTVRLILNSDRAMEYVHLKDLRPSGLEPLDVFSGYQWKNSLGYYKNTKDASTNFYIEYFPKGKYVFEYDLVCNVEGSFSSGAATLQNYYAPQMNARSSGGRIEINAK